MALGNTVSRYRQFAIILIIFIAALAVRLMYLNQLKSMPMFDMPVMDEGYHWELAGQINSSAGLPDEPYFRAPLYPYFLALISRLADNSIYTIRLIQLIIGSFLTILILFLGRRFLNRRAILVAAGLVAVYPTFIYYDASLLITSMITILTALLVLQVYRTQDKPNLANFVLSGFLLGLAALARPNILLFGPALLIWLWLIIKPVLSLRRSLIGYASMALACVLVIAPVTIRNYAVAKDFVLISWQGGFNFYLGNNKNADGWSATSPGIDRSWKGGYSEAIAIAENENRRPLKRSEVSDFWYGKAFTEISDNPGNFVGLLVKKIRLVFNGYEIPNNQHLYLVRSFAPFIKPIFFSNPIFFPYGVLAPLAIIGFIMSLKYWRKFFIMYLLLGSYIISILLFFVCARFRQPLIPFLLIFAVFAVQQAIADIQKNKLKKIVIISFALLALLIESNHLIIKMSDSQVEADNQYLTGSSYLSHFKQKYGGDRQTLMNPLPDEIIKARYHLQLAIKADPSYALAYNDLGTIAIRCQQREKAGNYFKKAISSDPACYQPYINYAKTLAWQNRHEEALDILKEASLRFPYNEDIQYNLGYLCLEMSHIEAAHDAFKMALAINPENTQARDMLSYTMQEMNR